MTRIILVHETDTADEPDVYTFDDPRSHRELIKAINTGSESVELLAAGQSGVTASRGPCLQWAVSHDPIDSVTVMECHPPVCLTPRQYDVLFGIVDGLAMRQIARRLGISTRTGYLYLAELKDRFGAHSTAQLIARAMQENMLPPSSNL